MTEIQLDFCEIAYNEANNEIRILVNSVSKDATLITLNSSNLMSVLDTLSESNGTLLNVKGRPMVQQELLSCELDEDEEGEYDEGYAFNYRLANDDLSEFYKGDTENVDVYLGSEEVRMINSALWDLGAILDYVMG